MKSKIIFFSVVAAILLINIACSHKFAENLRDKHIIPDIPVYTQIDLSIGGESNNWIDAPRHFSISSIGLALGYNGHGIIIFTGNNTEYKCYDATCTNCTNLTSFFRQEDLEGHFAQCPVCGLRYLLDYGTPEDTQKKIYPLKEYPVTKSGNKLIVSYK